MYLLASPLLLPLQGTMDDVADRPKSVKEVGAEDFIKAFAAYLKQTNKVRGVWPGRWHGVVVAVYRQEGGNVWHCAGA